jgi:hypothetical protein
MLTLAKVVTAFVICLLETFARVPGQLQLQMAWLWCNGYGILAALPFTVLPQNELLCVLDPRVKSFNPDIYLTARKGSHHEAIF